MSQTAASTTYHYTRWFILRGLAIVYFFAFASLATQIVGLVGEHGILPCSDFLNQAYELLRSHSSIPVYLQLPTVFWFNSSDFFLTAVCIAGILISVIAFFGIAPVFTFALLWFLYLSLVTVGEDFLSFQWDILLLETGFLAIFFSPWQWLETNNISKWPWSGPTTREPIVIIWLLRWLIFRLMFESGFVKLASGDPTWHNLTALSYHYLTQPLPTPIAWFAAKLPDWFNEFSVLTVFIIELAMPFLIFVRRTGRIVAAFAFSQLQFLILVTGNYAFFNLLTLVLCISLLDDQCLKRIIPGIDRKSDKQPLLALPKTHSIIAIVVAVLIGCLSMGTISRSIIGLNVPTFIEQLFEIPQHYFISNGYGLFAVMTTKRLEIQIQGSNDGTFWNSYEFKYKPGSISKAPPIVAPLQPRLDWQMWFASLSNFHDNPWFLNLAIRLLQGEPTVLKLLDKNPFPNVPPQYIRARLYNYHFTNLNELHKSGNWWKQELVGDYLPPVSLKKQSLP